MADKSFMKALIVEPDQKIAETLETHLRNELRFDCEIQTNTDEALEVISSGSDYDLIVVRKIIGETKTQDGRPAAHEICTSIYDKKLKSAVLSLGEFEYIGIQCACLPDHFKLDDFFTATTKLLKLSRDQISDLKLPDFISISINYFFLMNHCACDIYMKIKKGENEEFVKRINANDDFDKEAIIRYNTKFGLKEFFIRKVDRKSFYDSLSFQTENKLSNPHLTVEEKIETLSDSYDVAQNLLCHAGIDHNTITLAKSTIESMHKIVASTDKLGPLLKSLLNNPNSYAYRHCFMISLFLPKLLSRVEWCPHSQIFQTIEKMIFVTFFHDIFLEEDRLVMIDNKESFNIANLSENDRNNVLNHANKSANLVQSFPHTPVGVDVIIRQHHGMSNGVGFAEAYGVSISPLTILFIVVEHFVHELLALSQTKKTIPQIMDELSVRFPLSSYQKIIEILSRNFNKDF